MSTGGFDPGAAEDYIIGTVISSQTTPLTQEEEEQVAEYSMYLAALSLVDGGVDLDTAIKAVEQASAEGDIHINVKEDPDSGDFLLSVTIGASE